MAAKHTKQRDLLDWLKQAQRDADSALASIEMLKMLDSCAISRADMAKVRKQNRAMLREAMGDQYAIRQKFAKKRKKLGDP